MKSSFLAGLLCLFSLLYWSNSHAQVKDYVDSTEEKKEQLFIKMSGYVDGYYAYYTDSVGPSSFQKFPTVSPRNGFGLNTAVLTAHYEHDRVRGIVSLQFGDIAKSSWSPTYNNILEAYAGIKLFKNLWLDGGFFRTHIGAEGLFPKENIASSLALATFHEPYYESGFRLHYTPTDKLSLTLYLLNGYNIYEETNSKKSVGLLAVYALGDKGNVGYSNYIGDDAPHAADSVAHVRVYQNVFFNYQVGKFKMQLGADVAMQQNSDTTAKKTAMMYSGLLTVKYQATQKFGVFARGEVFNDEHGFLSGVFINKQGCQTGVKEFGYTGGVEYKPTDNTYIRLEARQLIFDKYQQIFRTNGAFTNIRNEIHLHLGISF